jgi:hypothetical protein
MPRLSYFYGISVYMYYRDHAPPHFHAFYGGNEAVIEIETAAVRAGRLPRRALSLIVEWTAAHRVELQHNWDAAQTAQPLNPVAPLD